MTTPLAAWFIGEGSLLIQAAQGWQELGHRVCGVASREPSIRAWALERGIPLSDPSRLVEAAAADEFDYLFSVVNLTLLGEDALRLPQKLAANFHDGYLPRYAGVNATVWALLNGESQHGVTWHEMTAGADEGRILVQQAFEIQPGETAFSLNAKCFTAGIETFRELAERITAGTLAPLPQDLGARTYFGFYDRPPHAMVLRFDQPADTVARTVRALDFGSYPNPVGAPKVMTDAGPLLVSDVRVLATRSGSKPGTVLSMNAEGFVVATSTEDVALSRLRSVSGEPLDGEALSALGVREGAVLPSLDSAMLDRLTESNAQAARVEGAFLRQLATREPLTLSLGSVSGPAPARALASDVAVPPGIDGKRLPALILAFAARRSGLSSFDVAYADAAVRNKTRGLPRLFANEVPMRIALSGGIPLSQALEAIERARETVSARHPYALDLLARQPHLPRDPLPLALLVDVAPEDHLPPGDLTIAVDTVRGSVRLVARSDRAEPEGLDRLARRLALFLDHASAAPPEVELWRLSLVSKEEERTILERWNATSRPFPESECIHTLFLSRARQNPDRTAVSACGRQLTYRTLDGRANALAHALREEGVGPDTLVGVHVGRGVDLLVAVLGIHKAGGAYVPLDPEYPADRLRFMIEDAGLGIVVAERSTQASLPAGNFRRLLVDDVSTEAAEPPQSGVTSAHLAYVIYTSGSTGKPKGVMVEHRNAVNFFCGMDDVLDHDAGGDSAGTWLAVTSLSFDISVLELLWTLTRGFHVVIYGGELQSRATSPPLDFSFFYFSASESGGSPADYRLLLEGARFADQNGFVAVWTPERHFHAFGGLYPNPSVTSAALAMITKNVSLRAGSCVSPLHSPLRIAEEWAFVDNLSEGRVGVSFASGWQPNDFAIRPEPFARRKEQMLEDIETVRRLWRGDRIAFKNGVGSDVSISTLPRPVQRELPIWITTAGSPDMFGAAGRLGTNVLTHLLGQTFEEVAEKVRIYRAAWQKAGHPGRGTVTLMLHTFIGDDEAAVKDAVRAPMKQYLKSAVGLIKEAAWSFPTFRDRVDAGSFSPDQLSAEEMDAVLEHAFDRYYRTSGLFGTVDTALAVVEQVRRIGVDEIACLIDFGVAIDQVLESLPALAELRRRVNGDAAEVIPSGETIAGLIAEFGVTHFQCTPSMAAMLVLDDDARAGLSRLDKMLVGGEAFPPPLARQLRGLVGGDLINVYGPTETTVWSSSYRVEEVVGDVPIGRPLANTEILILDPNGGLVAPGDEGELVIGGKGVARGYLGREELTRERFVGHPLRPGERTYRTGDIARFDDDGTLRFIGRLDQQIKIRGYRIEIGEIEACLTDDPAVRGCVVVAREDTPGDKRLVAYVVPSAERPDPDALRARLGERLPDYMLPSTFVFLTAFPETPNRKIDRKALPPPERQKAAPTGPKVAPISALEEAIAAIWRDALRRDDIGMTDNFFDLGGHSLLTIQVLGKLRPKVSRPLSLVDLFRYPTIRSLADFLCSTQEAQKGLEDSAARGTERQRIRRAMAERRRGQ